MFGVNRSKLTKTLDTQSDWWQNAHQATVLSLSVATKMFIGLVLLGFKEKITGSPSSNGKMLIFPFTNPLKLQTLSCKLHFEGWGYKSL